MTQYGFFIDQSRCIGCNACNVSCLQWHNIPPGLVRWMRIHQWEKNTFPTVAVHVLPVMCYHCANPVCVKACPNRAIYKEDRFGAVLVDSDRCQGARKCWQACPYGAPQYAGDEPGQKMSKCTMCIDRLGQGLKPICVLSCSMRALEFGPMEEIVKKYGNLRELEDMPRGTITRPSVVFKPLDAKKPVLPWNPDRALELWQKRDSPKGEHLPDLFTTTEEITRARREIVGRNKLVLKPRNGAEKIYYTTDDE